MPFTEGVQVLGSWNLRLSSDTPPSLRNVLATPMQQVLIFPSRLDVSGMTDAAILSAAMYNGVLLKTGPSLNIGGAGILWWLGIDDSRGPNTASTTPSFGQTGTLAQWAAALVDGSVTSLGITGGGPVGGTFTGKFGPVPVVARKAWEQVCDYFQVEYRMGPDFVIDYGTVTDLYGATPTVVVTPGRSGRDIQSLAGLHAVQWDAGTDWSGVITQLQTLRSPTWPSASGTNFPSGQIAGSYGPSGALNSVLGIVSAPQIPDAQLATWAQSVVDRYGDYQTVRVTVDDPDARLLLEPGYRVYAYDPDNGIQTSTNQVNFGGQIIFPTVFRVSQMTWPFTAGMGCVLRVAAAGPTFTHYDLSDYIVPEEPATTIELAPKWYTTISGESVSGSAGGSLAQSVVSAEAAGWLSYTPAITGSGTAVGNGTVTGWSRREGSTVHLRITWTLGSTSTIGAGGVTFSLPSGMTAIADTNSYQVLRGLLNDSGTASYDGQGYCDPSGTTIIVRALGASGTYLTWAPLTATVPHTWASTDVIALNGTIEIQ